MEAIIICQGITIENLISKIDSIVQHRVQEKISQLQQNNKCKLIAHENRL
jgi:hypothetical protein